MEKLVFYEMRAPEDELPCDMPGCGRHRYRDFRHCQPHHDEIHHQLLQMAGAMMAERLKTIRAISSQFERRDVPVADIGHDRPPSAPWGDVVAVPVIELPLTKGFVAVIDEVDCDLAAFKWQCEYAETGHPRAYRRKAGKQFGLHRVIAARIMGKPLPAAKLIMFLDGNGLNCRRANLRLPGDAESAPKLARTRSKLRPSGYVGVFHYRPKVARWSAELFFAGRNHWVGTFDTPEEANDARLALRAQLLAGQIDDVRAKGNER